MELTGDGRCILSSVLVAQLLWVSLCLSSWPWSFCLLVASVHLLPSSCLQSLAGGASRPQLLPFLWPAFSPAHSMSTEAVFPHLLRVLTVGSSQFREGRRLPPRCSDRGPVGGLLSVLRKDPCAKWVLCWGPPGAPLNLRAQVCLGRKAALWYVLHPV